VLNVAEAESLLKAAAGHYDAGRLDEAAALYEQIERGYPRDFRAAYSLAMVDIRRGRLERARSGLSRVLARAPDHFSAQHNLGAVCQELGRWGEAAAAYRRALELEPKANETRFRLAIALAVLGRPEAAIACYRTLASNPSTRVRALTRLAILSPEAIDDGEAADLRCAAHELGSNDEERIGAFFALGEILEKREKIDEAFAAFAAGNALERETLIEKSGNGHSIRPQVALRDHARSIGLVSDLFTPRFIAAAQGAGMATVSPIFIVGMPRSGSSLVEQILTSHPKVQGMGETGALSTALEGRYPRPGAPIDREAFGRLAVNYLAAMRARGWRGASRFVDKTLENHLHVGMIHLMFPRAIILHSVRDPVDTCLSCYRQLFASGNETLYDLAEIGAEYVAYRQMMDHWARVLPGRVIDVDHEALVASPDQQIRWLVTKACGLAWDGGCLRFHQAAGAVRTASAAQVRRPIFTSSIGRWRRYEKQLGPLLEALEPLKDLGVAQPPPAG
jgi:thioredoxin-like negative regulator of GroEL